MFSSLDPENPYKIIRDNLEAQKAAIESVAKLFNKGGHGFKIITQIAEGEMTIDSGIRDIKNMLCAYAEKIISESD